MAALAAIALVAAACTDTGDRPLAGGPGELSIGLRTEITCDELVDATRTDLTRMVEQTGVMADPAARDEAFAIAGSDAEADAAAESAPRMPDAAGQTPSTTAAGELGASDGGAGEVVSGTNIQEAGVDEGDILKTDGKRIVTLSGTTLRVISLDGTPEVDGSLLLPSAVDGDVGEMFLRGDEVVVLIPSWGGQMAPAPAPMPEPPPATTQLPEPEPVPESEPVPRPEPEQTPDAGAPPDAAATSIVPFDQGLRIVRVDISDPSAPEMMEEKVVEGSLVASRMVDGAVKVVVRSPIGLTDDVWAFEDPGDLDQFLEGVEPADVLPAVSVDGEVSPLGGCGDVAVLDTADSDTDTGAGVDPAARRMVDSSYAEPNTVTVLSIGDDLADLAPTSVSGMADVVYASTDSLYVTNTGWGESGPATFVHRFDTSGTGPAVYTGSGTVLGAPLNQYSLSESGDTLRIVTTTEDPVAFEDDLLVEPGFEGVDEDTVAPREFVPPTEGRLTVLSPAEDGTLTEIGSIEDLGVGERVQSVRFLEDMAYVVTFRQTDPLYAIDLSDPTAPQALGELKITGFSEYLHPVGEGLLLGIGREATESGFDTGFKASLFDVSDPTKPAEIDKWVVPEAWSDVGNDPHAFNWDPVAGHAMFPLEQYPELTIPECPPEADCEGAVSTVPAVQTHSMVVLSVGPEGLSEVARLTHDSASSDPWIERILRSVVVDRDLWTMSHTGLGLTDADAPGDGAFVAF